MFVYLFSNQHCCCSCVKWSSDSWAETLAGPSHSPYGLQDFVPEAAGQGCSAPWLTFFAKEGLFKGVPVGGKATILSEQQSSTLTNRLTPLTRRGGATHIKQNPHCPASPDGPRAQVSTCTPPTRAPSPRPVLPHLPRFCSCFKV